MKKTAQGFTLVELLVVIAIIAILAAVVVLIINPIELTKRGRDAARLSDLANLQNAINVAVQESTDSGAIDVLCTGSEEFPCTGQSTGGDRDSDGSGWVKVNLSAQQSVSVPTLPIDPVNSAAQHYTYCASDGAWEINTFLESDQQEGKMLADGGNDDNLYEVGSNLKLIGPEGAVPTPECSY